MGKLQNFSPILVTGASGYIASWIIKNLLEKGFTVHGTVRNIKDTAKTEHLTLLAANAPGSLHLFEADLLQPGSFTEAMTGCGVVIHTASPFVFSIPKDPENTLIKPAVEGTRNVLESVNRTGSVTRVVLTSSVVAIYGDPIDVQKTENQTFTENHWNTTSNHKHQAYSYSKTLAEKAAWEIAEKQNHWKLIVMNPGFVLGPSLTKRVDSTSIDFIINLSNGKYKTGISDFVWSTVDIREVADAHIAAATLPEVAPGRHILVGRVSGMVGIANILKKQFGDKYEISTAVIPKWLTWLIGPLFGISRKVVKRGVSVPMAFDNNKSRKVLGITFRPLEETLKDQFQQLIRDGLVKEKKR